MNIFLKFEGHTSVYCSQELRSILQQNEEYGNILLFISEGKICNPSSQFSDNQTVIVQSKLYGGKGGFGAKLKTEGGKKVRPNENMFSRDLQGQPVVYATINREYEEFYRKKVIQNQNVEKQLADFQVVSNTYKEDYAYTKLDSTYNAQMQENQKRLKEAMKVGMKKYLQKKSEGLDKKVEQEQVEKKQEVEIFEEDKVKQQQKAQDKDSQSLKRPRPIGGDQSEKKQPQKRVKLDEAEPLKKTQEKTLNNGVKLLSAREKLKSLFKK